MPFYDWSANSLDYDWSANSLDQIFPWPAPLTYTIPDANYTYTNYTLPDTSTTTSTTPMTNANVIYYDFRRAMIEAARRPEVSLPAQIELVPLSDLLRSLEWRSGPAGAERVMRFMEA